MVKAARAFVYGGVDEDDQPVRTRFAFNDDIPADIADDIPDDLILEKVAKSNPDALSREQLLQMAGVSDDGSSQEEFNEEEFREGLSQFANKGELVAFAEEAYGLELNESATRSDLEDAIVAHASGQDEEEEDEEDQ